MKESHGRGQEYCAWRHMFKVQWESTLLKFKVTNDGCIIKGFEREKESGERTHKSRTETTSRHLAGFRERKVKK